MTRFERTTSMCAALLVVVAGMGAGCRLFFSYELPEEGETGTAPSDDAGLDASPMDVDDGDSDAGGGDDGHNDDAVDTPPDTPDVGEDSTEDGNGDVDASLPPNQCPAELPSYRIRPAKVTPNIDGRCTDPEFEHARKLPFPSPDSGSSSPVNNSDNTIDCRAVWVDRGQDELHACCEIEDEDLIATTEPGAPREAIYGGADGSSDDDRVEWFRKCDREPSKEKCAYKLFLNNREPRPIHYTSGSGGPYDNVFHVEARTRRDDDGYTLEWRGDLGFDVDSTPGRTGLCNFMVYDVDDGGEESQATTFGGEGAINYPDEWGCCFYE